MVMSLSSMKMHNVIFIKRVIGTPGDKVEYEGDQLYVNDKRYQSLI